MKRHLVWSTIFVICLAVLGGLYFVLNFWEVDSNKENFNNNVSVFHASENSINEVIVQARNSKYILNFAGDWSVNNGDGRMPLNQNKVGGLLHSVSNIDAICLIDEHPLELEQYGLKCPEAVLEIVLNDDERHKFFVGDKNLLGDAYYFGADEKVYLMERYKIWALFPEIENLM